MTTIMFKRGKNYLVADIIQTVLEPLDDSDKHQVVYFCRDKTRKYRVPKSEVVSSCVDSPKKKKRKCINA